MKLNKTIAQNIVQRAMKIIGNSVNVMDENGIIIASGNPARLNQRHTGAVLAVRENRIIEIDDILAKKWNGEVQPGINVPINYLGEILGVIGISGIPEQVKPYAELVKMTAELIIEQYILLEKERWERRYKEEFILQLLKGGLEEQAQQQQADFFAFDLNVPRAVVLIKLLHSTPVQLQNLVAYSEQFSPKIPHAVLSLEKIALLMPVSSIEELIQRKQLSKLLPPDSAYQDYKISVGAYTNEHFPLHLSYQTAVTTLHYGLKFFPKKSQYFFSQYKLPVLLNHLADSWQATELLEPLQKLYQKDTHHLLQKTLQQYFLSNCDLTLTSQKLFIHVNTLRYRLTKIEQITSLSFNNISDFFVLYLSTVLHK